jgi:preprotein translocase subunit SecD
MHQRLSTAIAIVFFVSSALACSFLRPKPALTWHLLIEIDAATTDKTRMVGRTVSIIERRLDAVDIQSATVIGQGTPPNGRILVSLPDVPDRERVKKLIISQGLLELSGVISLPNPSPVQTYSTENEARASMERSDPGSWRVLPYRERGEPAPDKTESGAGQHPQQWVVVEVPAIVDGSDLRNASALQIGVDDTYHITFSLGPDGSQKFGAWTGAHINDYIGVVLNGEVKSIAYIKSQIYDQGEISGRFTKQSAEDLALILRAGALPAPVKIIEEGNNK